MNFAVDWTDRVDFMGMRKRRKENLQAKMKEHNLDGLVVFRAENIRYMTGLRPLWWPTTFITRNAAIMGQSGDPVLYVTSGDAARCQATMNWLPTQNIRPCGTMEDPGIVKSMVNREFLPTLEDLGLLEGRIGVDAVTLPILEGLRAGLTHAEIVDGDECVKSAKAIKNEDEVKLMRQSSQNAAIAMEAAGHAIGVGVRECEVLAKAMERLYSLGMEVPQCNLIVTSGQQTAPLHRFASDKLIERGDLVFMDLGGCFNGYFSDFTRTVVVGKPTEEQKRIYATVYEELMVVHELLKPGHTNQEVNQAARQVIARSGYAEHGFHGVLGHSVGISGFEAPLIGELAATGEKVFEFQPGMIFSCEPAILVPNLLGGGGVRLEDTILITETGNEILTKTPYCDKLMGSGKDCGVCGDSC